SRSPAGPANMRAVRRGPQGPHGCRDRTRSLGCAPIHWTASGRAAVLRYGLSMSSPKPDEDKPDENKPDGIPPDGELLNGNPPEGFVLSSSRGPYTVHNGPFYHKVTPDGFWHGLRVRRRHCNSLGITHGGLLMTFADGLLGTAVFRATKTVALTMRMNSDFL